MPTLAPFHRIFRHIRHIQFVCYLDFQKMKKDLEKFFFSCHKVNFRKKPILAIFRIIFRKIEIISDVIIPIAEILKKNFYHCFYNIAKYDCQILWQKHFPIRIYAGRDHYVPHHPGHDYTKIPWDR